MLQFYFLKWFYNLLTFAARLARLGKPQIHKRRHYLLAPATLVGQSISAAVYTYIANEAIRNKTEVSFQH
jgi:hypothetical protein